MKLVSSLFIGLLVASFATGCGGSVEPEGSGTDSGTSNDADKPASETGETASDAAGVCAVKAPTAGECPAPCPTGTVCAMRPQAGGVAYLGCVAVPPSCAGTPTCECMGCLCGDWGLKCDRVEEDHSTGTGTDLRCK